LIVDTDILIWYLRGNENAKSFIEKKIPFSISVITYMELIQGTRNKKELKILNKQLQKWNTKILHITPEISARALFLVEEYSLSHSMELADALIGASAIQCNEQLCTANYKHYNHISNIDILKFEP
jgi:predicted nucleic acid-binding protein